MLFTTFIIPIVISILARFFNGLADFMSWHWIIHLLYHLPSLRRIFFRIIFLNVVIFLGSIYILKNYLIQGENGLIQMISLFTWFIPAYGVCTFINNQLYQETAKELITGTHNLLPITRNLSEELYRLLFFVIHLSILGFLELFSKRLYYVIGTAALAWLYSLYAFEYYWNDIPFERRISRVEKDALYHLGFGFIPALSIVALDPLSGFAISSLSFGFAVILASKIPPLSPIGTIVRIPVFKIPLTIANFLVIFIVRIITFQRKDKSLRNPIKRDDGSENLIKRGGGSEN